MKKHKRLKAAKRKQHNTTAKVRHQEWLERCRIRDLEWETTKAERLAKAQADPKPVEPYIPTDPLLRLFDSYLDGSVAPGSSELLQSLRATLPHLWRPDGLLDVYALANHSKSLIDTEGFHGCKEKKDGEQNQPA